MTVGERIRVARKAKGLTQKQLGEACGIAEPTIRRYELGKLNPKYETLQKIAKPLGISVSKLYGVEPLSEDYLLYREEKYIRYEIKDPEEKEDALRHLEKNKREGLTFKQREIMSDAFDEVYHLLQKLGYTGFISETYPPPSNYDPEKYKVCKDERTGKYYICDFYDFFTLADDIQDYAIMKLQEYFSRSVSFVPDNPPAREPVDFWEHPEKYIQNYDKIGSTKPLQGETIQPTDKKSTAHPQTDKDPPKQGDKEK